MKQILLFLLAVLAVHQGHAQDTWAQKTNYDGGARHGAVGFTIGSNGYVGTGSNASNLLNDFWEYDPATDTWTQKANFGGSERDFAVGFSIGSKGYIGTGETELSPINDFWEYNPATNAWTQKADFGGDARQEATGFSIGSKGYIGTGIDPSTNGVMNDFWEYDPATDTWAQKANFGGNPRYRSIGFSVGTKGYLGIGYRNGSPSSDFWEYDPVNDTWTRKADFGGGARENAAGFSLGAKAYIGTGDNGFNVFNDFWEYDVVSDTWTRKADFEGTTRHQAIGFSIGNKGYIGTGIDFSPSLKNDFWEYTPVLNSISTNSITGSPFCAGSGLSVSFTTTVTANTGNTFTTQLSDASGSFTSSVNIGTLNASTSGTINATIPSNIPSGSGYRIRVVSSDPAVTGTDNGTNITVNALPVASISYGSSPYCTSGSATVTQTGQGGGVYSSTTGLVIDAGTGTINLSTSTPGTYLVTYSFSDVNTCSNSTTANVTINALPAATITASGPTTFCAGGSISLTASAGGSYLWSTGAITQAITVSTTGNYSVTVSNRSNCSATSSVVSVTVNPSPNVTATAGMISCYGEPTAIIANASGGSGSFKYQLSGGPSFQINNIFIVGAGTYSVMVQDAAGCTKTTSPITIIQPPALTESLGVGTINCYGSTTTLMVTAGGGTPPYTYKMENCNYQNSNSFTTGAGTHIVTTRDSKGCTSVKSITINQPSAINVTVSAGAILCNGGTTIVSVAATGGTPAYSGTGIFTKGAGTYTFTIIDSRGCKGSKTITISQPAVLTVSLNSKTNVSCYGGNNGSITVKASGGTQSYSYKINTASSYQNSSTFNNLTQGTYSVAVKDKNGCTVNVTGISVTQPSTALALTLVQKTDVSCYNGSNGSIKVSGSGGTSTYKYTLNNGSYGNSSTFTGLCAGTYTVTAKDANGCAKSMTVVIKNGTGKCYNDLSVSGTSITGADINAGTWLKAIVSPNPSETEFTLTLSGNSNEAVKVRVIDMYGRIVHQTSGSANQSYKFGQRFAGGIYIAEIVQGRNVKSIKIIKGN